MLPQWFWRVRFWTADGGGETLVVAPHRAAAKQAIGVSPEDVTAYESAESGERVTYEVAAQRFGGYCPKIRVAAGAVRERLDELRG